VVQEGIIDNSILLIIIGLTVAIGFTGYRLSKSFTGFVLANRSLGPWLLAFSIMATYFSAASFLGGGGATYLYNLGFGAWLTAWHVIGVVLLWTAVADRLFEYVSKTKVMSIPELVGHRYGSNLARIVAALAIIALFSLYLVSVYKGGAIVLSTQLGIDIKAALLLMVIPTVLYVVVGGLRATAINNLFLGSLMLVAATIAFVSIMGRVGGPLNGLTQLAQSTIAGRPGSLWLRIDGMGPPPAMQKNMVPALIMGTTFSIGMAQVALPNLLIQFYAARNPKAISRGRIIGPVLVAVYALLMFSLGAFCHLIIDPMLSPDDVNKLMTTPDWVIPKTVSLILPSGLKGLVMAAPVAASMSTIALTVLTLSNTAVRDVVRMVKDINDERISAYLAKALAIVFSLVPIPLVLVENRLIVDIVSAAFGALFASFVGPITLGIRWKRASKEAAIASMAVGSIVAIVWYLYLFKGTFIHPTIPATLLALTVFIVISLVKKSSSG